MTRVRKVLEIFTGVPASDGAGVRLTRVISHPGLERFDPFLMLDQFDSSNPDDYIAGFPAHPHRGFEAITYLIKGCMRHQDSLGNQGLLKSGGMQWLHAAKGVIHSEMPEQVEGQLHGFQLWINLPAEKKMQPARYQDFDPQSIPRLTTTDDVQVTVLAGCFDDGEQRQEGAVQCEDTQTQYYDLNLPPCSRVTPRIADGHRLLLFVYEGVLTIENDGNVEVETGQLARMDDQGELCLSTRNGARVLLMAGIPLREPIVQYGPFVMNTATEIEQALRDYRTNNFV